MYYKYVHYSLHSLIILDITSFNKYTYSMEIIKVSPRGYCKGVVNAINIAKKARMSYKDEKIYILGMIVHNTYVSKALSELNIITLYDDNKSRLELLDEVNEGVVIFTAHGVSDSVKQKALDKNLICIDASCTDVIKTQNNVKDKLKEEYSVLYVGKKNHPEALAVLSNFDNIYLISNTKDIDNINITNKKIYVTNQTTMSMLEIKYIYDQILKKYPSAYFEEEICNATYQRQMAVMNLSNLDLLYVVGDPLSNNSNKLKDIALNNCKKVILIESASSINIDELKDVKKVGVTSGASTPTYLTNQVIEVLNLYNETNELIIPDIDIKKII